MKTYKLICILACIIAACNMNFAQPNCEYDMLIPVPQGRDGGSIPLPDLDEPDVPVFSRTNREDYRMLYFLHGLNGSESAWSKADAACLVGHQNFPARKVYTQRPNYYSVQKSFPEAASEVLSATRNIPWYFLPEKYDPKDGIMIGHSQGGLVSRYMDLYYSLPSNRHERNFGGLVTVATANQGAQILNNQLDYPTGHGHISTLIASFVEELSAGPFSEFEHSSSLFVRMIFDVVDGNNIKNKLKDFITVDMVGKLVDNNLPPITRDFRVGSSFLENQLNTYTPIMEGENETLVSTNIVSFYAIRDTLQFKPEVKFSDFDRMDRSVNPPRPIFVDRTIKNLPVPISFATMTFFTGDVNESEIFGGLNDEWVVPLRAHTTRMEYAAEVEKNLLQENEFRKKRNKYIALIGLHPYFAGKAISAENSIKNAHARKNAWQRGVNFLDNFDRSYRVMIGAWTSVPEAFQSSMCDCYAIDPISNISHYFGTFENSGQSSCESFFVEINPESWNWEIHCNEFNHSGNWAVWKHKDSDGVVLAESQMVIPQATERPVLLSNSTHMSVRNDENTREMLLKIFDGYVGDFFVTKEKD